MLKPRRDLRDEFFQSHKYDTKKYGYVIYDAQNLCQI